MQEYLKYEGYGNIPWLAPLSAAFLDSMSLGLSDTGLEKSDPNEAEQIEIARNTYPFAAAAGSLVGWLMPGSASGAAAKGTEKLLSPVLEGIGGLAEKGVQAALGKTAPKAAEVIVPVVLRTAQGAVSGYGVGAVNGGFRSIINGNAPLGVLKDANA